MATRLVVAVVQDYDTDRLLRGLTEAGFGATRLPSTGGFLRTGNTTVMIGLAAADVGRCLDIIAESCRRRAAAPPVVAAPELAELPAGGVADVRIGGAVVFVARVARFERLPRAGAKADQPAARYRDALR
jgi:uncharacterized protein YaaQ